MLSPYYINKLPMNCKATIMGLGCMRGGVAIASESILGANGAVEDIVADVPGPASVLSADQSRPERGPLLHEESTSNLISVGSGVASETPRLARPRLIRQEKK